VSTLLWAAEEFLGSSDAYTQFLNDKDLFGNTALHLICKVPTVAATTVVRMLLEEGADPLVFNRRGNSCLHVAAAFCNVACLEVILDTRRGGASLAQTTVSDRIGDVPFVDAMNYSGLNALHIAALTTNYAAVGALVDRGAQLDSGVVGIKLVRRALARQATLRSLALLCALFVRQARGLDNLPYLCGGSTVGVDILNAER
jgi:ankyrin repeat protein